MTGKIDARLKELGITLPTPPTPVASYVPYVISGKRVFISGQVTIAPEGLKYVGTIGKDTPYRKTARRRRGSARSTSSRS